MSTEKLVLPPSLAVVPNIPPSKQTLEQLEAEVAYWQARMDERSGWGAAVGAMSEMIRDCETWIAIRKKEQRPKRKIYVASPFAIQGEASRFAAQLAQRGHKITSGWLQAQLVDMGNQAACREAAQRDVEDVLSADTIVVLTDPRPIGAGHHVEYGIGLAGNFWNASRKGSVDPHYLIVAGPIKSIFHWLADEIYESPEKALAQSGRI